MCLRAQNQGTWEHVKEATLMARVVFWVGYIYIVVSCQSAGSHGCCYHQRGVFDTRLCAKHRWTLQIANTSFGVPSKLTKQGSLRLGFGTTLQVQDTSFGLPQRPIPSMESLGLSLPW